MQTEVNNFPLKGFKDKIRALLGRSKVDEKPALPVGNQETESAEEALLDTAEKKVHAPAA